MLIDLVSKKLIQLKPWILDLNGETCAFIIDLLLIPFNGCSTKTVLCEILFIVVPPKKHADVKTCFYTWVPFYILGPR